VISGSGEAGKREGREVSEMFIKMWGSDMSAGGQALGGRGRTRPKLNHVTICASCKSRVQTDVLD
jgi:hypothetical protein